jgi:hypothetical protein
MKEYRPAKRRICVSVGKSVRIIREFQQLSQNQLALLRCIPQVTFSAVENDRDRLGVERGKFLARGLKCHPGVRYFPAGSFNPPDMWPAYPARWSLDRCVYLRTISTHSHPPSSCRTCSGVPACTCQLATVLEENSVARKRSDV